MVSDKSLKDKEKQLEFEFMKLREKQEKERKKELNLPDNPLDELLKDKLKDKK
jgi:hypothetical protein|tara:strand:- start:1440 stop:1598 length:159 start_codon:yes stop_codon:yes gene_type:complete